MNEGIQVARQLVTEEEKRVLAAVLEQHEPSISSYGDVACVCGEEFSAGDSVEVSGYRRWTEHVLSLFEADVNRVWALRNVDSAYRS